MHEAEEEKPLDPALEKVRQKLMRLMIISIGILMLGIFGVLGAVIYRINTAPQNELVQEQGWTAGSQTLETVLALSQGERIATYQVANDRLVLEIEGSDGEKSFVIIDLVSGGTVGRVTPR